MAAPTSVWGVDIGRRALKALKLSGTGDELQVEAFDIIEHAKIIAQDDAERKQIIRDALEQFLARNNLTNSQVCVAVPGQAGFTRFVKLPPVEKKKIPDIVRFEAEQQIPFNINDVIWRWQTFQDPDSPDVEVGIFAMKRQDVNDALEHFTDVGLSVDMVQMAPLALYNFMTYDKQLAEDGATLLADVGTDKTDLVVADGPRIWTRTIQIGGNSFTEALVKAFKLSFGKAENLKRSAATSKYARQIFQAMRPVFADLVQEIQRSIGYYTSLHRESRFKRLIGLGNGFRLPGLQKFLEQNLSVPVVRIDTYNRIKPSPAVNAPTFTENVPSFAVAYGLAIQGLGLADISTNLLPGDVVQQRLWTQKRPWFAAAAAVLVLATAVPLWRTYKDASVLGDSANTAKLGEANRIVNNLRKLSSDYAQIQNEANQPIEQMKSYQQRLTFRSYWADMENLLVQSINQVFPDQEKAYRYARYLNADEDVRRSIDADAEVQAKLTSLKQATASGDQQAMQQARADLRARLNAKLTQAAKADLAWHMGLTAQQDACDKLAELMEFVSAVNRSDMQVVFIESQNAQLVPTLREAKDRAAGVQPTGQPAPTGGEPQPRAYVLTMTLRTPLAHAKANENLGRLKQIAMDLAAKGNVFRIEEFLPIAIETPPELGATSVVDHRRDSLYDVPDAQPARGSINAGDIQSQGGPLRPMPGDRSFKISWAITVPNP